MKPKPKPKPEPDARDYPTPGGEELVAGALAEMLEERGRAPHDPASSPHEGSTPSEAIPDWFRKLSDHI